MSREMICCTCAWSLARRLASGGRKSAMHPWSAADESPPLARSPFSNNRRPADGIIAEAKAGRCLGIIQVAPIENHALAHQAAHYLEIGIAELLPLRDDRQPVSIFE